MPQLKQQPAVGPDDYPPLPDYKAGSDPSQAPQPQIDFSKPLGTGAPQSSEISLTISGGPRKPAEADLSRPLGGGVERKADFQQSDKSPNDLSMWEKLNTSLVPQVSQAADAIAKYMDVPSLGDSISDAQLKGFYRGATEGAGRVLGGMLSPMGIALTLAGLGPETSVLKGIPGLAKVLGLPQVQALQTAVRGAGGAAFTGHGAYEMASHGLEATKAHDAAGNIDADKLKAALYGMAQGGTEVAGGALGVASAMPRRQFTPFANPNPVEAAAAEYGQQHNIPVNAGAATGNAFVQAVQGGADSTPFGSIIATRARAKTGTALETDANRLADAMHPQPVTPESSGNSVKQAGKELIDTLHQQANENYSRLRELEQDPAHAEYLPVKPRASADLHDNMRKSLGRVPSEQELRELRRIREELDSLPFTPEKLVRDSLDTSDSHYVPRSAGAPVYHDIMAENPGLGAEKDYPRAQVLKDIDKALESGTYTNAAKGALEVANKRMAGDKAINKNVMFDITAGDQPPRTTQVLMPVDIGPAQKSLLPRYKELLAQHQIVPLTGEDGQALLTLRSIVEGPRYERVSVVDAALGRLKRLAATDNPSLRTPAQGQAANAVKLLEAQVQQGVEKAGPDAVAALAEGRAATRAKYETKDTMQQLSGKDMDAEGVAVHSKLTLAHDGNIQLLRDVQKVTPMQIPEIARGWMDKVIEKATAEGGFKKAAGLNAEWNRLGDQTKDILFPGGQRKDLDNFFLLAKKLEEMPNPSRSATTAISWMTSGGIFLASHGAAAGQVISGGVLSSMLRKPSAVRALTRGMSLSLQGSRATPAMLAGAMSDIANAAHDLEEDKTK